MFRSRLLHIPAFWIAVPPRVLRVLGYLFALATGIGFVLSLFPHDLLLSGAVPDARLSGDVAQHVIGQRAFFADRWHWPLLKTTLLDWPAGVNIAMVDGNPLIALPLKLFSPILPPGFSVVQLWLALAYMLQPVAAVFALRSAGETRFFPAVAVALFAISMPTFLFRHSHSALSSHFILLAALGSYFRTTRHLRGGGLLPPVLLPISFLIHPYLAFMTGATLLAAPTTLALRGDRMCIRAMINLCLGGLLTVALAIILGYAAANPTGGFGVASMNALSPVYPTYSFILGSGLTFLDATGAQYEGYQYLGLGLLSLLLVCLVAVSLSTRTLFLRRHVGFYLACLGLTAFALSNVIYVGYTKIVDIEPIPSVLFQVRASGRLFWPVTYFLMIGSIAAVARVIPMPFASAVLLAAAWLQMHDVRDMNRTIKRDLRATSVFPVDAARLDTLLLAHSNLTILPTFGCGADATAPVFSQLLLASSRLRVPANTMYVARFAHQPVCRDAETAQQPLRPGELRVFLPSAVKAGPWSVPDGSEACRMLETISVCTLQRSLLSGLPPPTAATLPTGSDIVVGIDGRVDMLGPGWYAPEPSGVWSVDRQAIIVARFAELPTSGLTIHADGDGFTGVPHTSERVELFVNGHDIGPWDFLDRTPTKVQAIVPVGDLVAGPQVFVFDISAPKRPSAVRVNRDTRELGLFLQHLRFDPS
jgi:hypothetical protein